MPQARGNTLCQAFITLSQRTHTQRPPFRAFSIVDSPSRVAHRPSALPACAAQTKQQQKAAQCGEHAAGRERRRRPGWWPRWCWRPPWMPSIPQAPLSLHRTTSLEGEGREGLPSLGRGIPTPSHPSERGHTPACSTSCATDRAARELQLPAEGLWLCHFRLRGRLDLQRNSSIALHARVGTAAFGRRRRYGAARHSCSNALLASPPALPLSPRPAGSPICSRTASAQPCATTQPGL